MNRITNFNPDQGKRLMRLRDPSTGLWLHLDARSSTASATWSWSGTQQQASTLEQRAIIRDEPWPYVKAPMEEVTSEIQSEG